ncbi:hypothetical protein HanIR_Chr02g0058441 [Helianthus annuus]|nr:hypothetical protein HanIR_Chr02g0058441 [Helianthus annuus]
MTFFSTVVAHSITDFSPAIFFLVSWRFTVIAVSRASSRMLLFAVPAVWCRGRTYISTVGIPRTEFLGKPLG